MLVATPRRASGGLDTGVWPDRYWGGLELRGKAEGSQVCLRRWDPGTGRFGEGPTVTQPEALGAQPQAQPLQEAVAWPAAAGGGGRSAQGLRAEEAEGWSEPVG